jgi:SAM-dependent methyltransferase
MNQANQDSRSAFQEEEYQFPYHYLSRLSSTGFREHVVDSWGVNYVTTIEFLISELSGQDFDSIVDIGCGDGRFTRELALSGSSRKICGLDYSQRAIDLAKAMNPDLQNINFYHTDICTDELPGTFEAAVLMEVFEHIPTGQCERFVDAVHQLLVPGGSLYLTVPHENKPLEYKHFQHFSVESIRGYFDDKFEIVDAVPFERAGFRRKMMEKLLCNRFFVLNNQTLLNRLYAWQKKNLFACESEKDCQRIFFKAIAK